jgi:hypothetical protein
MGIPIGDYREITNFPSHLVNRKEGILIAFKRVWTKSLKEINASIIDGMFDSTIRKYIPKSNQGFKLT